MHLPNTCRYSMHKTLISLGHILSLLCRFDILPYALKFFFSFGKQLMDTIKYKCHSRRECGMEVVTGPWDPVMAVINVGISVVPSPP